MPSHNCINNSQCSVFKVHSWASFSRDSMKLLTYFRSLGTSVNLLLEVVGQNGLAFLRKSHAGCNSPPDCCQEPAFESILLNSLSLKPFASDHHFYFFEVVGQNGLEPSTSRLSVVCSSQLSYWPISASLLLVEISGIEPLTSCLQGRRSPSWAKPPYLSPVLKLHQNNCQLSIVNYS